MVDGTDGDCDAARAPSLLSDEKKLQILQEASTGGLSVADVARRHDVVPQQIYIWRRQLLANVKADAGMHGGPPRFLPVAVVGETEESEVPRGERASGGEAERCKRWPKSA